MHLSVFFSVFFYNTVKDAFKKIINDKGENGDECLTNMIQNGKYAQDIWASVS